MPDGGCPEQLAETYHACLAGTGEQYPAARMPIVRALVGESSMVTDMVIHQPGRIVPLQVWGAPIYDENGVLAFAIAAFSDITERRMTEERLFAQYEVARALAESSTLAEAAPRILRAIGSASGWDFATLWTVDASLAAMRCVDVWQREGLAFPEMVQATRSWTFREGAGLPGMVWERKDFVWIVNALRGEGLPRIRAARASKLRSAAGFPIMFGASSRRWVSPPTSASRESTCWEHVWRRSRSGRPDTPNVDPTGTWRVLSSGWGAADESGLRPRFGLLCQ